MLPYLSLILLIALLDLIQNYRGDEREWISVRHEKGKKIDF